MADSGRRVVWVVGRTLISLIPILVARGAFAETHTGTLPVFQSDFGGVGLLQTPTARMAPLGEFSFNYVKVDPYTNYSFSFQPFDWFEAGFRYTSIQNRLFGRSIAGDRDYLDKGVDAKFRLLDEGRYVPIISLGFRDFGGTGLFSSEYLVGSKRWYDLDFSLGIGWGYLGSRGDIDNPLRIFGERFDDREGDRSSGGGDFNVKQLFTGSTALFGGIQYRTPYKPLTLQIEYEGNDYENEPLNNNQDQDSPINIGARLRVNDHLTLAAGWERGNTLMLGGTLSLNFVTFRQPKNDPAPIVPKPAPETTTNDWNTVAQQLASNAGVYAKRISKQGSKLLVEGGLTTYRSTPESELRANRILQNATGGDIDGFLYRWYGRGMAMREDRLPREPLPDLPLFFPPHDTFAEHDYRLDVTSVASSRKRIHRAAEQTLYEAPDTRFLWSLGPALNQNYGGPDGYLYQIYARLNAEYRTDDHGWLSGTLAYTLLDNFDKFDYVADSNLPRVRTFIGRYLDETDLGVYNLQYTRSARLSENWFGLAYAGLLEQMYGGAGGEIMYRPFNRGFALGFDANYVKQRDFDTQFDFRDYETWVGNATVYINTGVKNVLAAVSVGRYLAGDVGTTINLSREFESGVRLGAYATFTDAGDDFGEGSFDKGIYLSLPLDLFYNKSSRSYASVAWSPLTRDGGAQLNRRFTLYGITEQRNLEHYWENFEKEPN